jgi:hypothetical protein
LEILNRQLTAVEKAHEASDTHGKNVSNAKL